MPASVTGTSGSRKSSTDIIEDKSFPKLSFGTATRSAVTSSGAADGAGTPDLLVTLDEPAGTLAEEGRAGVVSV